MKFMVDREIEQGNRNAERIAKELGLSLGVPAQASVPEEEEMSPLFYIKAEKMPRIVVAK
jgi:hypothetical protein